MLYWRLPSGTLVGGVECPVLDFEVENQVHVSVDRAVLAINRGAP